VAFSEPCEPERFLVRADGGSGGGGGGGGLLGDSFTLWDRVLVPQAADLTLGEREICAAIGPELKKRGLLFVGIDVIGGKWLTEINVTSPTGIVSIDAFNGTDTPALIWDVIEAKIAK
jgi:hypothetical protein